MIWFSWLAAKRSAGVTPEVNLRIPLHTGNKACKWGYPRWLWNSGPTSSEVQNRGISGPQKRPMSSISTRIFLKIYSQTRKHSSRMRTVRLPTYVFWWPPLGVDRILGTCLWKHYLPQTSCAGDKYKLANSHTLYLSFKPTIRSNLFTGEKC